ncbi:MAG: hypothetical protein ACK55I_26975, partial [bacterium]
MRQVFDSLEGDAGLVGQRGDEVPGPGGHGPAPGRLLQQGLPRSRGQAGDLAVAGVLGPLAQPAAAARHDADRGAEQGDLAVESGGDRRDHLPQRLAAALGRDR